MRRQLSTQVAWPFEAPPDEATAAYASPARDGEAKMALAPPCSVTELHGAGAGWPEQGAVAEDQDNAALARVQRDVAAAAKAALHLDGDTRQVCQSLKRPMPAPSDGPEPFELLLNLQKRRFSGDLLGSASPAGRVAPSAAPSAANDATRGPAVAAARSTCCGSSLAAPAASNASAPSPTRPPVTAAACCPHPPDAAIDFDEAIDPMGSAGAEPNPLIDPSPAGIALVLRDLEVHLDWGMMTAAWTYKQKGWVSNLVAIEDEQPRSARLKDLREAAATLQKASKPAAQAEWFVVGLARWRKDLKTAADYPSLAHAVDALSRALRGGAPLKITYTYY